jgi:hypothetical protein
MTIAHIAVTVLAALMIGTSAVAIFMGAKWMESLAEYGVPRSWWTWLGVAKAAGAVGLLAGLFVPPIGIAAATGLVLYFAGAVVTVLRARAYSHVPFPLVYGTPAAAALVLGLAA